MPLNQVAMVAAPEPRLLTVQPFDKGADAGHREGHPGRRSRPQSGHPGQPDPGAAAGPLRGAPQGAGEGGAQAGRGRPHRRPPRPHRDDARKIKKLEQDLRGRQDPRREGSPEASPTSTSSRSTGSSTPKRRRSWKSDRMSDDLLAADAGARGGAGPHRHHHGRQRPLGQGPGAAASRSAITPA